MNFIFIASSSALVFKLFQATSTMALQRSFQEYVNYSLKKMKN